MTNSKPKCKRFFRECGDFSLCINIGEKGYILAEHANDANIDRFCLFYYMVYGKGRVGEIFESQYIELYNDEEQFIDVQKYILKKLIFESFEDFHLIGINSLDTNYKWKSKMITNKNPEIIVESEKEYLVCLEGNPIINGKKLKRYDYSEVFSHKKYELNSEDNFVLGLFGRIDDDNER